VQGLIQAAPGAIDQLRADHAQSICACQTGASTLPFDRRHGQENCRRECASRPKKVICWSVFPSKRSPWPTGPSERVQCGELLMATVPEDVGSRAFIGLWQRSFCCAAGKPMTDDCHRHMCGSVSNPSHQCSMSLPQTHSCGS